MGLIVSDGVSSADVVLPIQVSGPKPAMMMSVDFTLDDVSVKLTMLNGAKDKTYSNDYAH